MVGQNGPGIDNEVSLVAELCESIQEIAPIDIGLEDLGFFNAPAHNMVESTRCIESWLSGHDVPYLNERILSSCFRTYVPFAGRDNAGA